MDFWPVYSLHHSQQLQSGAGLAHSSDLPGSRSSQRPGRGNQTRPPEDGRQESQLDELSFNLLPPQSSLTSLSGQSPKNSPGGATSISIPGAQAPLGDLHPSMSIAVETFGFFMSALGLLMLGLTLANSYWRVSTVHGNVITTNTIFENLWYSCATDSLGVSNCWDFPSMLALSGMG